ncbi:MAG: DUF1592 domain-containing protein [Opitutaceae bacterium]|nr:DUF1592 domain-containing protein [Opitutaceae bacterium]
MPLSSAFARWGVVVAVGSWAGPLVAAENAAATNFTQKVEPILAKYCYDCHGNGISKGSITFDEFTSVGEMLSKHDLWTKVLKNVRGGLMPPREEDEILRPSAAEVEVLAHWIKYEAFKTDPKNPDPGRVTARRLNRVEYRNTIRDLMGFDFNAEVEFPTDDTGHGFDNIGDVLTISPLHLEKYLSAAETIVDKAVPKVAKIIRERSASGRDFRAESGGGNGEQLNARRATTVSRAFTVEHAEKYQLVIEYEVRGSFDFDAGRAKLICRVDGEERFVEDVVWSERRTIKREYEVDWSAGRHVVSFEVVPLPPVDGSPAAVATNAPPAPPAKGAGFRPGATSVTMRINTVQVRGPIDPRHWIAPENYDRFFPNGPAPDEPRAREAYATEVLQRFATRAFRRPIEASRLQQLVAIAKDVYSAPGATFEQGIGRAMMAVLGSPRFIFRVEQPDPASAGDRYPLIDEYALASRLSYFLWSSMPDEELFRLAERGELRRQLQPQLARMLKDSKSSALVRNFTGQWLQARDVEFVPINARVALGPSAPRNRDGRIEFDSAFRKLMRSETEMYFEHLLREDLSVLDLVDSDYTFLNERLAQHYGVPGVTGETLRLVKLPADSPRGGVITQGTVLAVTSNPTRTSPVKRGLFILENILGTPPPPAPPNVPDLEESKKEFKDREPKLSEMLAVHRANPMCSSCHQRMDPLGLALENFNALGGWRETEAGQPIDPAGQLVTGEKFAEVRELKRILRRDRKMDVYQCLTEKLMTYALGRGLEYYDVHTVDEIAARLDREGGRISVLLTSIVESPAFQRQRRDPPAPAVSHHSPARPITTTPSP